MGVPGLLHVGLPKTGTTALQRFVLSRHPGIEYFSLSANGGDLSFQDEWDAFIERVVMQDPLFHDHARGRRFVEERVHASVRPGRVPLVSSEELTSRFGVGMAEKAGRASRLFPGYRVVLVIRHPVAWLQSDYLQHVCNLQRRPFQYSAPSMDGLLREATERPDHPLSPLLGIQFARIAAQYVAHFGRENVKVMLYEDFAERPESFLESLSRFCGIDPDAAVRCYRENGKAVNVRRDLEQVIYVHLYRNRHGRRLPMRIRRRVARYIARLPQARRHFLELSAETAARIADAAAPECDAVSAEWDLETGRHGYPTLAGSG